MLGKAVVLFGVLLALFAITQSHGHIKNGQGKDFRGYVDVNGTTFFIDTAEYYRDEAQVACNALNMTLITFQAEEKYNVVYNWLYNNGYEFNWLWTGALRGTNSSVWTWEPTGEEFTYFRWGSNQPSINDDRYPLCINFRVLSLGWDDDYCNNALIGYICQ
ncbi:lectin subunit alpha-like [Neocloeon triangulifer]|uniref:lectin subunit alpha-like n=1 Tax=Neocloeon triangulifer TaxID=2078957 RepID=UPI00286F7DC4|nr:lectin subunit alpha-like [Neocloeon triangulifer]